MITTFWSRCTIIKNLLDELYLLVTNFRKIKFIRLCTMKQVCRKNITYYYSVPNLFLCVSVGGDCVYHWVYNCYVIYMLYVIRRIMCVNALGSIESIYSFDYTILYLLSKWKLSQPTQHFFDTSYFYKQLLTDDIRFLHVTFNQNFVQLCTTVYSTCYAYLQAHPKRAIST